MGISSQPSTTYKYEWQQNSKPQETNYLGKQLAQQLDKECLVASSNKDIPKPENASY